MYPVLDQELKTLGSGYSSPHLGLCGMAFGAFTALLITIFTVPLPEPMGTRFVLASAGSGVFFLYFGLMAIRDWINSRQLEKKIRSETEVLEVAITERPAKTS